MAYTNVNEQTFQKEVLESELPVLADFWAEWCGPCKVLGPIVEQLSNDYTGKLKVVKINVDENNALAGRFGIMSIPTMKFFKGGKIVGEMIGAAPKGVIESEVKKHL